MATVIRETTHETIHEDGTVERTKQTVVIGSKTHERDFLKIYPLFCEVLAEDLRLRNGRLRLFLWFVTQIRDLKPNQEPIVLARLDEMANALQADKRTIQRYLKHLLEKRYLIRYRGQDGKPYPNTYVVNPELIYKGCLAKYFEHSTLR